MEQVKKRAAKAARKSIYVPLRGVLTQLRKDVKEAKAKAKEFATSPPLV